MAKKTWVNVGGVWKEAKNVWLKVNGVWKSKVIPSANIAGVWKDLIQYILDIYILGTEKVSMVLGINSKGPDNKLTKNVDHISLSAYRTSGTASDISVVTDKPINLTNYNKLYVDWYLPGQTSGSERGLVVSTNKNGDYTIFDAKLSGGTFTSTRVVRELDISSLSGDFYIRVHARLGTTGTGTVATNLYRLWLE